MSKQHTPTPWRTYRLSIDETSILDSNLKTIAKGMESHTAKRIVQVVNNHDRLVEALEQVIEDINTGNYEFGEHMFDEWNQLLNELKA